MALRTDSNAFDVLVADLKTGLATGLAKTVRRAVSAMDASGVPYSVIGASALAAHGFPRMTRDLDIVVMIDHADAAIRA